MKVIKTGYTIRSCYSQGEVVSLFKLDLVGGPAFRSSGEEYWLSAKDTEIWTTTKSAAGRTREALPPDWVENIFFTLDGIEQRIQKAIDGQKLYLQIQIDKLNLLRASFDNVDLSSLPQDTYVSPFSGKKA